MDIYKAKAPGKVMILGEHSVVYGNPCIVSAVGRVLEVKIKKFDDGDVFDLKGSTDKKFIREIINTCRDTFFTKDRLKVHTYSDFAKFGLGTSSAVTVAGIRAFQKMYDIKLSSKDFFQIAYRIVKKVQGESSGFDIASSMIGETIYFDGKNKTWKKIQDKALPIAVIFTGKKADTCKMIKKVKDLYNKQRKKTRSIFNQITGLVRRGERAIRDSDYISLGKIFDSNQSLLGDLGVSTSQIDRIIRNAKSAGALGAKISGAGGGDCIIAIYKPGKKKEFIKSARKFHLDILDLSVGNQHGAI